MRPSAIAMCVACLAVGCDARPAREPSRQEPATSPAERFGAPSSAIVYSSRIDAQTSGRSTAWHGGGNTNGEARADPDAKERAAPGVRPSGEGIEGDDAERDGTRGAGGRASTSPDAKIAGGIRRQLLASRSLSLSAKTVSVTTSGGKVTLRGTVRSDEERAEIEAIARAVAGVTAVENDLQVTR